MALHAARSPIKKQLGSRRRRVNKNKTMDPGSATLHIVFRKRPGCEYHMTIGQTEIQPGTIATSVSERTNTDAAPAAACNGTTTMIIQRRLAPEL